MALLEIRNITRRFADFEAVKDVSFEVASGEFFTLLGPSGCGKTTILRMIAGFDLPDAGQILLNGHAWHIKPCAPTAWRSWKAASPSCWRSNKAATAGWRPSPCCWRFWCMGNCTECPIDPFH
jgi:ABC-type oligopeptide transport system ATPase subunit